MKSEASIRDLDPGDRSILATLDLAHTEFDSLLGSISEADWHRPTPCDDWNVGQLVDHVTAAASIYAALMDGLPFAKAVDAGAMDGGAMGADAVDRRASNRVAVTRLLLAFESPDLWAEVFLVPGGRVTGAGLASVRIFDVTVHCWDLARAIGAAEMFPDAIVDHAWRYARTNCDRYGRETAIGSQSYDDPESMLVALLVLTGRSP